MPYTLKTQQIAVKDPDTGVYSGVDILAEQTTEGLLTEITATGEAVKADVSAQMATERSDFNTYVTTKEAELDQYKSTTETNINTYVTNKNQEITTMIAEADEDVSDLEDRKQDVATAVSGMLSKGVDNSLTTANVPAESKAVGDLFETIVQGKSTQPNDKWNRLWIKPSASDYEIPTMDDLDELNRHLSDVSITDKNLEYILVPVAVENMLDFTSGAFSSSCDIGEVISFGTETYITHFYVPVNSGESYLISYRQAALTRYTIAFTDDNNVILSLLNKGNGTIVSRDNYLVTVPSGATKMFVANQSNKKPNTYGTQYKIQYIRKKINACVSINNNVATLIDISGDIQWKTGYIYNVETNVEVASTNYKYSNPVDISKFDVLELPLVVSTVATSTAGVVIYDHNMTKIGYVLPYRGEAKASSRITQISLSNYTDPCFAVINYYYNDSNKEYDEFFLHGYTYVGGETKIADIGRTYLYIAQDTQKEDFSLGRISSDGIVPHTNAGGENDRICTHKYYHVFKGDKIICNNMSMVITFYDLKRANPTFSPWVTAKYVAPGNESYGEYIIDHECLVRLTFSDNGNAISENDFGPLATICHAEYGANRRDVVKQVASPLSVRKPKLFNNISVAQDGTFVDGKLWMFSDGVTSGAIKILDINTGVIVETNTHDLGHANSVDYNANNNCLLAFYTENHNPHVLIYSNPTDDTPLLKTDANCLIIPLYNSQTHLSPTSSLCWGESNNIIYAVDGVYSSYNGDTGVYAESISIHKLLLGMGDNDLSSEGYGTFISGKTSEEYNGTVKVLKTYSGKIRDGIDTKIYRNTLQTIQGMEYDGYLYAGWGTNGHNFLAIQLDDDTDTYWVHHNYMYHDWNYSHTTERTYEPELVALDNGRIYCGSTSRSNGSLLLSFER